MAEPAMGLRRGESTEFAYRSWPAEAGELAPIRAEIRRWLAPLVLPGDAVDDVVRAVNEAARNCVEHAYPAATTNGSVELTFWTEPRSVCIEIVDHGAWRTPANQPTGRGRESRSCGGSRSSSTRTPRSRLGASSAGCDDQRAGNRRAPSGP